MSPEQEVSIRALDEIDKYLSQLQIPRVGPLHEAVEHFRKLRKTQERAVLLVGLILLSAPVTINIRSYHPEQSDLAVIIEYLGVIEIVLWITAVFFIMMLYRNNEQYSQEIIQFAKKENLPLTDPALLARKIDMQLRQDQRDEMKSAYLQAFHQANKKQ
jgi:hypothetical protein